MTTGIPDEEAIRNLLGRYYQLVDDHDYKTWPELLSEDFSININGRVTHGRDNNTSEHVDEHPLSLPPGRHLLANTTVKVTGETAEASSDWYWIGQVGVPSSQRLEILEMGRAVDTFCKTDGRWELRHRDQRPLFFRPGRQ